MAETDPKAAAIVVDHAVVVNIFEVLKGLSVEAVGTIRHCIETGTPLPAPLDGLAPYMAELRVYAHLFSYFTGFDFGRLKPPPVKLVPTKTA